MAFMESKTDKPATASSSSSAPSGAMDTSADSTASGSGTSSAAASNPPAAAAAAAADAAPDFSDVQITFLYKLVKGVCAKSFGLNVARLAEMPLDVVQRAADKSSELEHIVEHKNGAYRTSRCLPPSPLEPRLMSLRC
jgi:hypothetical protein